MEYKTLDDDKIVLLVDGEEKEFDLLISFQCKQNGRTYIGFTDGLEDEEGQVPMTFASVSPEEGNNLLYDITSPEEEAMIDEVLEKLEINLGGKA